MNNKFWLLIAGVVGVAILAMGWFLGVSPKLDEMNAANEQRASVEAQNQAHEAKLVELKKEFQQLDALKTELADAQASLPPGDELSSFLGELHRLEASSGVVLTTFGAGDGQNYVAAPGATTLSPLVTQDNFIAIPIDLTVQGTRPQVMEFLSDLQYGKRLFLVIKLTVAQSKEAASKDAEGASTVDAYQGTISGFVYVLVDPSAPPPTPTPVGALDTKPSPSPSPAP
ncbi:MAG TPA: type 4a pilus biogenesis protein PilO [Terrimesophilobacter sp.]|jgi:Tfp pilus assembly protein PilO|uniref:type 4a pilus biogenesis protein PilO n=1 Tax=Terrimesophilobacter sp. TaxID=2906435 RepID=UPI002F9242FD